MYIKRAVLGLAIILSSATFAVAQEEVSKSTADHSKFPILQKDFQSGPEVTEACLTCHTEADDQMMHSIHFTWDYEHPETGQRLAKATSSTRFAGRSRAMNRAAPPVMRAMAGTT